MRVTDLQRRHVAAIGVAALVLFAGCSGLTSSDDTPSSTTQAPTETTTSQTTQTTTTSQTTQTTDDSGGSGSDTGSDSGNAASAEIQGTMTVLIGGSQVALDGDSGPVTFRSGDRAWFSNESGVTVADAVASQDVELSADALTYEDTTYSSADEGTTVEVRVNGESVDPTQYTLQSGDSVWVYVSTSETDIQPPGEYIQEANDHQHGAIEVVVNGEAVNLSKEQYQHMDDHFHLEGGDGDTWHAHTWSATYGWAMSTLDMNVTSETVTINGTTYDDSDDGTSVSVMVNGEPVENPGDYRLKDGDSIEVVVEETN